MTVIIGMDPNKHGGLAELLGCSLFHQLGLAQLELAQSLQDLGRRSCVTAGAAPCRGDSGADERGCVCWRAVQWRGWRVFGFGEVGGGASSESGQERWVVVAQ
ncbi:hypothetical protein [Nocardia sp. NPDC004860]|uniref:hypothetical protein n=1 Tax=Nocardia sp. NPDC004860 TaxID=3154557 RepID=UPI0033A325DF